MTENKIIEYLEQHGFISDEVKDTAINAIKENEQYHEIEEKLNGVSLRLLAECYIAHLNNGEIEGYQRGRILTNEDVDKWEMYKAIGSIEELQNMKNDYFRALSDWRQYRKIGTVEELQALKEKAEPKKPILYGDSEDGKLECPNCKEDLWELKECGFSNCPHCGQKLDWS